VVVGRPEDGLGYLSDTESEELLRSADDALMLWSYCGDDDDDVLMSSF
jgi:hypothetical protein